MVPFVVVGVAAVAAWDKQDIDTVEEHHLRGVEMDNKMEAEVTSLPPPLRCLQFVAVVDWANG